MVWWYSGIFIERQALATNTWILSWVRWEQWPHRVIGILLFCIFGMMRHDLHIYETIWFKHYMSYMFCMLTTCIKIANCMHTFSPFCDVLFAFLARYTVLLMIRCSIQTTIRWIRMALRNIFCMLRHTRIIMLVKQYNGYTLDKLFMSVRSGSMTRNFIFFTISVNSCLILFTLTLLSRILYMVWCFFHKRSIDSGSLGCANRCCRRRIGVPGFGRIFRLDSTIISSKATPSRAVHWKDTKISKSTNVEPEICSLLVMVSGNGWILWTLSFEKY